jgi:putative ABC transport system substrate-binding protein
MGIEMHFCRSKWRDFITLLGGAAVAWPLAARAHQAGRVARIGRVDFAFGADSSGRARVDVFQQGMEKPGWTVGRDLAIDCPWRSFDIDRARLAAAGLLSRVPDVIVYAGTPAARAFRQAIPA